MYTENILKQKQKQILKQSQLTENAEEKKKFVRTYSKFALTLFHPETKQNLKS